MTFPELKEAIERLEYPVKYYKYLIDNGIDNNKCLDILMKKNKTFALPQIPFGHFLMIHDEIISNINESESFVSQNQHKSDLIDAVTNYYCLLHILIC